ncbi:unnamed protein product [Knipowitschia caucasica]|uniref:L1 transposable element RRM domain-containing protein n=2 Tax=Knipowitschia caucasica TaxID=637954 RepID=A0AAV2LTC7_KNICA
MPKSHRAGEKSESAEAASITAVSKEDLLAALAEHKNSLLADLNTSLNRIDGKLDCLQQSVDSHDSRLTSLEDNAESVDGRLEKLEACYLKVLTENEKLRTKVTDLEGRSRRSNVRLVGLPESIEGVQPTNFFAQLLQEVFGRDLFPSLPELDRAHRSLAPKPKPGDRPRPVMVCFHRFQQKELIMREARVRKTLVYQGHTFRLYEDYPSEVVTQRKVYKAVMSSLYELGLKPALLYPAKLRITQTNGTRKLFTSVDEAERYVEEVNKSV